MKSQAGRTNLSPRSASNRSRVSNNTSLLPGVDGRSAMARRFHDLVVAIANDQGGPDRLSEARVQLIRRFAAASVLAEALEAKLANGKQIDVSEHALLCSSLVRLSTRIGINRVAKTVPDLRDYLEAQAEEAT